jgi:hypothetical protein
MTFLLWLGRKLRRDPQSLLELLMTAHDIERDQINVSAVFRAGYRTGLHLALTEPELAKHILETPGHPGQTEER